MTTGKLPVPQAAGPVAGQPGHFAHHDWLEGSVGVLNERLMKQFVADLVISNVPTGTWQAFKYDLVTFDTGLDAQIDATNGGVVLGQGAPTGYYRLNLGGSWASNTAGSRRIRLLVNGVEDPIFMASVRAPSETSWGGLVQSSEVAYLPTLATLRVEGFHSAGANLDTGAGRRTRLTLEYLGDGTPPGQSPVVTEADDG